jgi:hypothetical protein
MENIEGNKKGSFIKELKTLPPVSKNILTRMQELGPFLPRMATPLKIYQMKNSSVYQGQLIVPLCI